MNRRLILQILALTASAVELLDGQALGRHYFPNDYEYGKKITARMAAAVKNTPRQPKCQVIN